MDTSFQMEGCTESFNLTAQVKTLTYGSYIPTTIIDTAKDWAVVIEWRTTGADSARITGSWELKVYLDVMGAERDQTLGEFRVNLTPGLSPIDYGPVDLRIKAQSVPVGIYKLVTFIMYVDVTGQRGIPLGYAEGLLLQLYDSGIPASDTPDPQAIRRAETISVLTALENSNATWRTIDDLSRETKLAPGKILEIIDSLGEHVMKELIPDTEGRTLYATRGRVRREQRKLHRQLDVRTAAQQAIAAGTGVEAQSVAAYERIVGSTTSILSELESNYSQTREQANAQHRLSLIAGGIGILLISTGVVALIGEYITVAVITTIVSVVFDTMATFFFLESRKANTRVDQITTDLTEAYKLNTLIDYAESMRDQKKQDELKAEIIQTVLSKPDSE